MSNREGRLRRGSDKQKSLRDQVDSSKPPLPLTLGAEAADRWLTALGLPTVPRWHAEITITADIDTSFELNIYAEEWGVVFRHDERASWIRVMDIPFVHGRDDFQLLARAPDLLAIQVLAAELEEAHGIQLRRANANIRTNIPNASEVVRDWLLQPLPWASVKRTVELCGDEMHLGIRCTKTKGHDGDHEYQGGDRQGQLRWK